MKTIVKGLLAILLLCLASCPGFANQWFFHSFKFPDRYLDERLSAADNWKQNAQVFCSSRVYSGALKINDAMSNAYNKATMKQGNIAVSLEGFKGDSGSADLYLYCSVDTSRFYMVGHYTGDLRDQIWQDLYAAVYAEFRHETDNDSAN